MRIHLAKAVSLFFATALLTMLAACGGGGSGDASNPPSGGTTPAVATMTLTGSTNNVTATTPSTLSATLKNAAGAPLSGVVVTFATAGSNIGTFFPAGATALTNANGIASITLAPGTASGADTVSASATVAGATITSNAFGFSATGTTSAAQIALSISTGAISSTTPATLTATVRNATGALVSGVVVTFATGNTGFATFSPSGATALTDANGIARISLLAGSTFGADTVTAKATIDGTAVTSAPVGFTVSGTGNASRLTLATSNTAISASAPATLTATLVDAAGTAIPGVVVQFATQGSGYGTFFPSGGTALTSSAGIATISLNAGSSIGADTVTATATVNGTAISSGPVGYTVSAAPVTSTAASITFGAATPTTIAIKGTGGTENSAVVFTVRDSNGNALANQAVTFSLNTTAGGLALASTNGTSGANGSVSAVLQSGTTATPVRVTATLTSNPAINAVSSQLVVSTALPHQNGFTLSANRKNIEAFNIDNVTDVFTATLSDRYGNFVPDGTAVSFRTAAGVGSINPSCTTAAGKCSVTFGSSGVRPTSGRLAILATAVGEESFVDANGNGVYDAGETFGDLPEAFIDANFNDVRDTGEEFIDFNNNGQYDGPDGLFNGVLRAAGLTGPTTINVRQNYALVLSTSQAKIPDLPTSITLQSCVANPAPQSFTIHVADLNGNPMAPGTTITFATNNGAITSTPTTYSVIDDNVPVYTTTTGSVLNPRTNQGALVTLVSDSTVSGGTCTNTTTVGALTITVTSPGGTSSIFRVPVLD